ncbi:hypothetical protein CRUP_016295, partial [Coryphaenoides rupestris]
TVQAFNSLVALYREQVISVVQGGRQECPSRTQYQQPPVLNARGCAHLAHDRRPGLQVRFPIVRSQLPYASRKDTYADPRVDFKVDESSDVPILDDCSSSPLNYHQEPWLVGTDIENIERRSSQLSCGPKESLHNSPVAPKKVFTTLL